MFFRHLKQTEKLLLTNSIVPKFCSHSLAKMTAPFGQNIVKWDVKPRQKKTPTNPGISFASSTLADCNPD